MSFLRDVHQCARSLAKSPSLPAIAILSLGLGIGVNTTLFSLFKSLFLDDISAAQPGRLVRAWVGGTNRMSFANFRDLENSRAFSGWAGYTMAPFTLRTGEQGSKIWGQIVTPNFFDVLGVKTASGRTFSNDEQAAVLSHAFWRQRFEGASDAIGRTINLNNQTYTIVGVLPEGYRSVLGFAVSPQVYVPFSTNLNRELMERSRTGTLEAFGRLAPGVTDIQAKSALLAGAQELKRLYPKENEFLDKVELFPMSGLGRVGAKGYPTPLAVFSIALLVISGLVLLIACANVSGLLLARGLNRKRDITVRLALGASRMDILRHLLAESCVLATLGTGAGLLISLWFTAALPALPLPISFPIDLHVSADWRLIVYATALAFASTIACGLTPAWQALQFSTASGLGDRSGQASRRGVALRNTLVVGQMAVSFALLVIASMALRSLQYVSQVNPGFDTDNVLNVKLETAHKQMTPDQQERFLDGQLQELRKIPVVTHTRTIISAVVKPYAIWPISKAKLLLTVCWKWSIA